MPKLNNFKVTIETGDSGAGGPVLFNINSHKLPFENVEGGTGPGETFEGGYDVNSFAHSLSLVGPQEGKWDIKKIVIDYQIENTPPYSLTLGAVTLDETNEVNIWQDPPLPTFEV